MTTLVLLGGPVGVGKSSAMDQLAERLANSALLDADHVWRVPENFSASSQRSFAHQNVNAVLRGYFEAGVETVVVNWVFARPELYEPIIHEFTDVADRILQIYLTASVDVLASRISERYQASGKTSDLDALIAYAKTRAQLIDQLAYPKIDTSTLDPSAVADQIIEVINNAATADQQ